jgi:hypothetical protein
MANTCTTAYIYFRSLVFINKLEVIPAHAIKSYDEEDVQLHQY